MTLDLTKWTKTSSYMFKKYKSVELFLEIVRTKLSAIFL